MLGTASSALAQELNLSFFAPTPGDSPAFTIESSTLPHDNRLGVGVAVDYAHGLLERDVDCALAANSGDAACTLGDRDGHTTLVSDLAQLDLLASLALFDAFELGASLPLVMTRAVEDLDTPQQLESRFGIGDLRLSFTAPLSRTQLPIAFTLAVTLPTASDHSWSGSRGMSLTPAFVLERALGHVTLSGKLGFQLLRRSSLLGHEQDDALLVALGAAYALPWAIDVLSEARLSLGIGGHGFSAREAPLEIDLGARVPGPWATRITLGAGAGGFPGERGIGAPALRVFAAVRGTLPVSRCKLGPEDYDGFADGDACADPDNDADGVLDAADGCSNDAEDRDGFADADGCPDRDNDADGILDAQDLCPNRSEDRDGYEDKDGCPEPDNDADGIADGLDVCRMDPEDRDGFEDDDGCPEPGPGRTTVTLEGTRILLSDRIYFEDDADTIRAVSRPVLDELAEVVRELVRKKRLRVEGHSDNAGGAEYNLDLSYRRAKAVVEYLKARGVPAERLEHVGYGSQRPLAPNDTPEGRALNRRVEFTILDAAAAPSIAPLE